MKYTMKSFHLEIHTTLWKQNSASEDCKEEEEEATAYKKKGGHFYSLELNKVELLRLAYSN